MPDGGLCAHTEECSDNQICFKGQRLTAYEVGAIEMFEIRKACERHKSFQKAAWHAERYGRMALDYIWMVKHDIQTNQQSSKTCNRALDAYNLARMAHSGWRALRGL